jgi:DnaJ-class molecular chaperone
LKTHYEILGVSERASQTEIKAAFRALALKWHPDKHEGKKSRDEAETKFKAITNAYKILTDAHSKLLYDERLEREKEGARERGRAHVRVTRVEYEGDAKDIADLLRKMAEAEMRLRRAEAAAARAAESAEKAQRRAEGQGFYDRKAKEKEEARETASDFAEHLRKQGKKAGTLF